MMNAGYLATIKSRRAISESRKAAFLVRELKATDSPTDACIVCCQASGCAKGARHGLRECSSARDANIGRRTFHGSVYDARHHDNGWKAAHRRQSRSRPQRRAQGCGTLRDAVRGRTSSPACIARHDTGSDRRPNWDGAKVGNSCPSRSETRRPLKRGAASPLSCERRVWSGRDQRA
jgi:hypothetical protein